MKSLVKTKCKYHQILEHFSLYIKKDISNLQRCTHFNFIMHLYGKESFFFFPKESSIWNPEINFLTIWNTYVHFVKQVKIS